MKNFASKILVNLLSKLMYGLVATVIHSNHRVFTFLKIPFKSNRCAGGSSCCHLPRSLIRKTQKATIKVINKNSGASLVKITAKKNLCRWAMAKLSVLLVNIVSLTMPKIKECFPTCWSSGNACGIRG